MTLNEQQAICDAATPGPWEAGEKHGMDCVWFDVEDATGEEILSAPTEMNPRIVKPSEIEAAKAINRQRVADLEFCATARTEWPALIEAHRKALAEIERLKVPVDSQSNDLHEEMSEATGMIVAELEKVGWHPCPAMKVADEAMRKAFEVWNRQVGRINELMLEIERLKAAGKVLAKFAKRHGAGYMSDMTPKACEVFEEAPSGT